MLNKKGKPTAIDLFSGCGGMTFGLKKAGFSVISALENEPLASKTYRKNHKKVRLKESDIKNVDGNEWLNELDLNPGELDLLAGCPPCQGFSSIRTLNGARKNRDPRNNLVMEMGRLVEDFKPKAVLMENVPGLTERTVFKNFLSLLKKEGYKYNWEILNASDYGVPQRRRRLVLIAGKGVLIPFGKKVRKKRTVRSTISNLSPSGKSGDILHDFPENRSPEMKKWIEELPKDGGSRTDMPKERQRPCHQRSKGFKDVYGRMAWDAPAPTLTGGCCNPSKGRFLHPEENRNITMREAALLQSFPKSFKVPKDTTKSAAATMIGNALPPEFVKRHSLEIRKQLISIHSQKPEHHVTG